MPLVVPTDVTTEHGRGTLLAPSCIPTWVETRASFRALSWVPRRSLINLFCAVFEASGDFFLSDSFTNRTGDSTQCLQAETEDSLFPGETNATSFLKLYFLVFYLTGQYME